MTVTATLDWKLQCSGCEVVADPAGLPTICPHCGQPWLVRYPTRRPSLTDRAATHRGAGMWRFRAFLPLSDGEEPITLGEGDTPLLEIKRTARALGFSDLWLKDEGANPTGSFKARGMAMAVTRAVQGGAQAFVVPTAGNAGVALAAYSARAGLPARIYAPASTPPTILAQIRQFGAELELLDGHIGDCGAAATEFASRTGAFPMSTLREPYRIEGKKTLGLELARQLGWKLPDAIIYPAGGGTGLIGMWLAFQRVDRRRLGDGFAASSLRGAILGLRTGRPRLRLRGRPLRTVGRSMDGRERSSGPFAARGLTHATGDQGHWRQARLR